jgi:hypothetical protein
MFLVGFLVEMKMEGDMKECLNCWEFKKCGREPGGEKASELGICPATNDETFNLLNRGKNGGRICWAIAGTFCGGKVQGTFANKQKSCIVCDFFQHVRGEEDVSDF